MTSNAFIDLATALWLGFIGACIGSFLNVVAYRMPLGMSIIWKPSHCPQCNHAIRAYDNVPVFGWLWLRGRCRDCGEPISPRYAIVEFVMGLAFFVLAYAELFSGGANLPGGPITEFTGAIGNVLVPQWPLIGVYVYHGVLLSLLMSIALVDMDGQKVPRSLFWFGAGVGFILISLGARSWDWDGDWDRVYQLMVNAYGFILTTLISVALGMGFGLSAGAFIAVFWRGKLKVAGMESSKDTTLFERSSQPYSKTENLLAAFALVGLFVGERLVFFAMILVVIALWSFREILPKRYWETTKPALPILFGAVTALLIGWKHWGF